MHKSPGQKSELFKDFHHQSNSVIHWWLMDIMASKTLSLLCLIHRMGFDITVKFWYYNSNFVIVKPLIKQCNSALSGAGSNKALHLTSQHVVSLRYTMCCRSAELKR